MDPQAVRYTREHEWVSLEGDLATVGISDHAQKALGDITFVELPAVGRAVAAGGVLGVIESVKAASDVYAPVAGTVAAVNEALSRNPEIVNRDPFGEGWLCRLSGVSAEAWRALMDRAAYQALLRRKP
jgi:glycine cleavage system H protein